MSPKLKLVLAMAALISSPAFADTGTPQEREACRRDTVNLCKGVPPEDGPMLNCLQTNREKLNPVCRALLERNGQ